MSHKCEICGLWYGAHIGSRCWEMMFEDKEPEPQLDKFAIGYAAEVMHANSIALGPIQAFSKEPCKAKAVTTKENEFVLAIGDSVSRTSLTKHEFTVIRDVLCRLLNPAFVEALRFEARRGEEVEKLLDSPEQRIAAHIAGSAERHLREMHASWRRSRPGYGVIAQVVGSIPGALVMGIDAQAAAKEGAQQGWARTKALQIRRWTPSPQSAISTPVQTWITPSDMRCVK